MGNRRLHLFLVRVGQHSFRVPSVTPPLGILSLAAWLRSRFNLQIQLADQRLENCTAEEIVRRAVSFGADIVGVGGLSTSASAQRDITVQARQALPNALIVVGGPHVSAFGPEALADTAADVAIIGEGELSFEAIIRAYLDGGDYSSIPGLVRRLPSGEVVTNPGPPPLVQDLDSLPFLAYDLIDVAKYWRHEPMALLPPHPYLSLSSSRGCPFSCMYCHRIFGKHFREQSPERIVAEIEHLQSVYHLEEFEFVDDVFNLHTGRVIDFCQMVQRRNLKIKMVFPNALRCDILTQEVVDALADTGLYFTCCALESGSPRIQDYIGKHLNIPRFHRALDMLTARKVFTFGFAMLGFPTETEAELQQTIDAACQSSLHLTTFHTVLPFPNTELYRIVERDAPEKLEGLSFDGTCYVGARINLSAAPDKVFYEYQRKAFRQFYLNPRRVYRVLRDYPARRHLPSYVPLFLAHVSKGIFG
jgi:radical SAM superfamily enzyme YgiQ (UPF0313 family)